jgi:hypothetical protein
VSRIGILASPTGKYSPSIQAQPAANPSAVMALRYGGRAGTPDGTPGAGKRAVPPRPGGSYAGSGQAASVMGCPAGTLLAAVTCLDW